MRRFPIPSWSLKFVVLFLMVVMSERRGLAEDWPQFRGVNASGISRTAAHLPATFSPTENVAWKATVGDGIGCPVVAAGRVFVSGMTGEQTVSLFAYEAKTGKELWRRDFETGELPEIHKSNSQASSTAAADAERVYFYFTTLGMITVDARTGEDIWKQPLPVPFFVFKWGPGCSPILYKDLVIFLQDDDLAPAIYAFDAKTGALRWEDDRFDMAVNYTHPVVCSVEGRDEIVVAGTGLLIGYDPETGKRHWKAKILLRNIKTTPVVQDGVIYISLQSAGIANQWLNSIDQVKTGNNDGKLDRDEVQAFVGKQQIPQAFFDKTFGRGDLNKDGFLEGRELDIAFMHPDNFAGKSFESRGDKAGEEFVMAIRGGGEGDVTQTHVLWKHPTKYTDHIVSPFVDQGRMFLVKTGGITTIFNTETGKPFRGVKRLGTGGDFFASPVAGDGKLYLTCENGKVLVLKNDETYEELAENDLEESLMATPAIADGYLYYRTRTQIIAFHEDPAPKNAATDDSTVPSSVVALQPQSQAQE